MVVEVRPAAERFRSVDVGTDSRHSFSFGRHYDPTNVGFGSLTAYNEETVEPGHGFPDHAHAEVEIVTWVLAGALAHTDSLGSTSVLRPGDLQVQSAGTGIVHAEIGHPTAGATRFVQAWLRPDQPGGEPAVAVGQLGPGERLIGAPRLAAGGQGAPVRLRTSGAALWLSHLVPGEHASLPTGPLQHIHVAAGRVRLPGQAPPLTEGDCLRLVEEQGLALVAETRVELLIWSFAHRSSVPGSSSPRSDESRARPRSTPGRRDPDDEGAG